MAGGERVCTWYSSDNIVVNGGALGTYNYVQNNDYCMIRPM